MSQYPAPKEITQPSSHLLAFTWPDASVSVVPLKLLRDECPCAACKGETILGKHYEPLQLPTFTPGMYEVARIEPVGKYGLQFFWKDGHDTGIYSWEYLHLLCAQMER
jgi:DUF971 family protein